MEKKDWKLRKAPGTKQQMDEINFFQNGNVAECEPPSKLI